MALPDAQGPDDSVFCAELATLDGVTYVSVPEGVTLPEQPLQLEIQPVALTPDLRETIKAASPLCQLIGERVVQMIRAKYDAEEEAYFARIGIGHLMGVYQFEPGEEDALLAFGVHVEAARAWGRAERAKLGL